MIDPYPYKKEATDLLKRLEDDALSQGFVEEDGRLYASALVGPREKLAPVLENPQVRKRLSDIAASGYRISLYPVKGLLRLVVLRSESDAGVCVYDQLQDIDNWYYDEDVADSFGVLFIGSVASAVLISLWTATIGSHSFVGYSIAALLVGFACWSSGISRDLALKLQYAKRIAFRE